MKDWPLRVCFEIVQKFVYIIIEIIGRCHLKQNFG